LEHGLQVTLDVETNLFAFSKLADNCARTQQYLMDGSSQSQCLSVFAEAGIKPSFIKSLSDMAPLVKSGNSQTHKLSLEGKCTEFNAEKGEAPTTVPPNWLTTPYVITRTKQLKATFSLIGPSLRISPDDQIPIDFDHRVGSANFPTRNIILETKLFPIMRTSIVGLELFAIPSVSSHIQIKYQPRDEPGPCDASTGQLCVDLA
jgi:hypothetical protein